MWELLRSGPAVAGGRGLPTPLRPPPWGLNPSCSACSTLLFIPFYLLKGRRLWRAPLGLRRREQEVTCCPAARYLGGRDPGPPQRSAPHPPGPALTSSGGQGRGRAAGRTQTPTGLRFCRLQSRNKDSGEGTHHGAWK